MDAHETGHAANTRPLLVGGVRRRLHRLRQRTYASNYPRSLRYFVRGYRYGLDIPAPAPTLPPALPNSDNPLEAYFDAHTEGAGIFKWRHYFDIYHRHLARFRGQSVHLVEVGLLGGGCIDMWREYFGPRTHIYGIDIDPRCTAYEREGVQILTGDQADPRFWRQFLETSPTIDIVIDDGGHAARQQAATLEGLLAAMRPGGVYVCEDIPGPFHYFHSFVDGFARPLNLIRGTNEQRAASALQQQVASVHRYPNLTVIEKPVASPRFEAPSRGTQWLEKNTSG